ncbi:DNA-binding MarR family transcriptional regulator [Duganella sp. 1224]|uniref:MarR family winged helix-turn-helix transcriptional regulator n=1 Tax=Duganella sp. 1224 TaxID=2587052 RepID=UPI0015CC4AF9|nr:MarR family winged helix-turn-helix transcriptional regulator [Duganella sp. 1224]NYE59433.1 DNA-binding MarR family transcriptional regulator [Duganella sp. 1224]
MTKPLAISDCNCLAVRQAARAISALYDRHLAPTGLSSSQFSILAAIQGQAGVPVQELADVLVMDRTSMVRALQPLTRDGYVTQQPDPAYPRKLLLSLTAEGRAIYQRAHQHWQDAQAEFEAGVGTPEAAALRQRLAAWSQKP